MKLVTILGATLLSLSSFGQESVTVTTAPGNTTQTFYSLQNGEQASAVLAEWDLAFEINSFNSSILVNTAKGLAVYETPVAIADWATLMAPDEENWTAIHNSEIDWSAGALTNGNNLSQPDGLDLGWGAYNMTTHTVAGTKVYVIVDAEGGYKKLRINSLATSTYSFTWSDLDGGNEQTGSLVKTAFPGKNFGYFSFATGATLDPEPLATNWDLVFTKYVSDLGGGMWYGVAGVLQNKEVGVLQVDGTPTDMADPWSGEFNTEINTIGSDWKTHLGNGVYEMVADRTYFVQDLTGNIWKLIFTAYGGAATGEITFTQELVSSTGVQEAQAAELVLYPNPATGGQLNMIVGREVRNGQLSILDMGGKLVKQQVVNGSGGLSALPIDIAGLEHGLYMVQLISEGSTFCARVAIN